MVSKERDRDWAMLAGPYPATAPAFVNSLLNVDNNLSVKFGEIHLGLTTQDSAAAERKEPEERAWDQEVVGQVGQSSYWRSTSIYQNSKSVITPSQVGGLTAKD